MYNNKLKIKSIKKYENWETREIMLDTICPISAEEKQFLSTVNEAELIEILGAVNYPLFPLEKTFYILDTLHYFSDTYKLKQNNTLYKIIRKESQSTNHISLHGYFSHNDRLIVSILIKVD